MLESIAYILHTESILALDSWDDENNVNESIKFRGQSAVSSH